MNPKTTATLEEKVRAIPNEGWQSERSEKLYIRAVKRLKRFEMPEDDAIELVEDLYLAAVVECRDK